VIHGAHRGSGCIPPAGSGGRKTLVHHRANFVVDGGMTGKMIYEEKPTASSWKAMEYLYCLERLKGIRNPQIGEARR
jgi:hypothetical protein